MRSTEADATSPAVSRIAVARKIVRRAVFIAAPLWLLSPLAIGLAISAGAPEWLWRALVIPATATIAGMAAWVVVEALDAREQRLRAAAEDLAEEEDARDRERAS